jgi:Holliday junction resolvase
VAASSRRKGLQGEREVARIWQAAGFDVRNLEATGDEAPQGTVPVVAFRQNRGEWYAALPLESLAELVRR